MERTAARRATTTALLFTVLVLAFAVIYWIIVILSRRGVVPFTMEQGDIAPKSVPGVIVWLLFRQFSPALAGVIALRVCHGRDAVKELGRSLTRWRVPGWLYLAGWFGIIINAAVVMTGYATHSMHFHPEAFTPGKFVLFFFFMALLDGPLGEEIGWRGVLLPQLMATMRPLSAALIVGVVWYVWHLPMYAVDGKLTSGFEHAFFLYTCVALSVIFTWFMLHSNMSTFLAVYLHTASNYSTFVRFKLFGRSTASTATIYAYGAVLLVFAAMAAVALMRGSSGTYFRRVPTVTTELP